MSILLQPCGQSIKNCSMENINISIYRQQFQNTLLEQPIATHSLTGKGLHAFSAYGALVLFCNRQFLSDINHNLMHLYMEPLLK